MDAQVMRDVGQQGAPTEWAMSEPSRPRQESIDRVSNPHGGSNMSCEHGKCGCKHEHGLDITEVEQTRPHDAPASCCGGHQGPEAAEDERLEVGRSA
jgi:hypothetical protein